MIEGDNSLIPGPIVTYMQPSDNFYNNTDTAYWDDHQLDYGDGSKELSKGATSDKNAEAKFKFLT